MISVDTKKRELLGNFKNAGRRWEGEARRVFDHDFRTDSSGVAIPYGIYDVSENRGALVIGVSHDTPRLRRSCDCPLLAAAGRAALLRLTPASHLGRQRRQQQLSLPRLEDRTAVPTGQRVCPCRYRRPLPERRFEMEPHRASPFLGDLTKLGGGTAGLLPEDSQLRPHDHDPNRAARLRLPGSPLLSSCAASPPRNKSPHSACSAMKLCPSGITPSSPNCKPRRLPAAPSCVELPKPQLKL